MLARFVRLTLLLEFAAYIAIGAWLRHAWGWSVPPVVAAALAVALGGRFLLVCTTIGIGHLARSPRPRELQLGVAGTARMVLGEARALIKDNFYYLPWESHALRRDTEPRAGMGVPVVLAHGYLSNRGYFRPLVRALEARGVSPIFAPNFPSFAATIEHYGEQLHARIEAIARSSGHARVVLVCHSMGGLAAREYLRRHGSARIAKLITIASPHHGTLMARLGLGENSRQMTRGSAFLAELERHEARDPPAIPAASIYSVHDNIVSPQETSRLPWATNIALAGLGHIDILGSERMIAPLAAELRAAGVAIRG